MLRVTEYAVDPAGDNSTKVTVTRSNGTQAAWIYDHPMDTIFASLIEFNAGELVQNAFPYLNGDEREFLLTGLTPDDWAAMFPEEEAS